MFLFFGGALLYSTSSIFETFFLYCILGSLFDDTFNKVRVSFFWGFVVIFLFGVLDSIYLREVAALRLGTSTRTFFESKMNFFIISAYVAAKSPCNDCSESDGLHQLRALSMSFWATFQLPRGQAFKVSWFPRYVGVHHSVIA